MAHYRAIPAYYDAEYDGSEMLQQDVPFFLDHLPKKRRSVLEIAAGTARASIPIAQAGHRVVGVDYDAAMLDLARHKRDAVGLTERDLRLVRQDALRLSLRQRFDWACIFFNTLLNFTTLEQQDRLLRRIRAHLKPGGRFWFDVFQPNLELLSRPHSRHLEPGVFYVPQFDRSVHRDTEIRVDPARQLQHVTYHYLWHDADGRPHRETVQFDLTFVFPRELRLLLERNGFKLERLYGNYDGSDLDADSPRMIGMCRLR